MHFMAIVQLEELKRLYYLSILEYTYDCIAPTDVRNVNIFVRFRFAIL